MAIDVICTGCHKRFQVSDQYAGQKGPCPGCKTIIEIPRLEDVVVVHERETTSTGAPAKLDSIRRQQTTVSKLELVISTSCILCGLILAFIVRTSLPDANSTPSGLLPWLAGIALGAGTSLLGYVVLRPQDTEIVNNRTTLLKGILIGVSYGILWRIFGYVVVEILTESDGVILPAVIILALAVVGVASFVPAFVFSLEYMQGFVHVFLFIASLAIYALIAGKIAFIAC